MNISRPVALLFFFTTMVFFPIIMIGSLFCNSSSVVFNSIRIFVVGTYVFFIYFTGYWGFLFYRMRSIILIMYIGFAPLSLLYYQVDNDARGSNVQLIIFLLIGIIVTYLIIKALMGFFYEDDSINLKFPFSNGKYYVFEGGDSKQSRFINYHFAGSSHKKSNVNESMRYAVDIAQLNKLGSFANGLLPTGVDEYIIYNKTILCPCDGTIYSIIDSMENEKPFTGSHPYNIGNQIIIETKGHYIILGHIQKGSILAKVGEFVRGGQPIARVGNSGLTEFPHLHIHAVKEIGDSVWDGKGVPMRFDGKLLVKNSLVNIGLNK